MSATDPTTPLDELLELGATVMVGTASSSDRVEFRPLTVARVRGGEVQILIDTTAEWAAALHDGDRAYLTLSDTRSNTWASLDGQVTVTRDPEVIDELWNAFAAAYFDDGRQSPGIGVLSMHADRGTYWKSPSGRIGSLISLVKAKFAGVEESGEHGAVAV